MSSLSTVQMFIFAFAPMVLAALVLLGFLSWQLRSRSNDLDGPATLLAAAVTWIPVSRFDWARAMLAELHEIRERCARWRFAIGCARAAILAPAVLGPVCGLMAFVLPTLSLPLLWLCAISASRFMTHDDFFNGELVPGIIGGFILLSLLCMFCGVPLGIAGWMRGERHRWLSVMGAAMSIGIFLYLQIVQQIARA